MADSDRIDQFLDELGRRGHEPLPDRIDAAQFFNGRPPEAFGGCTPIPSEDRRP